MNRMAKNRPILRVALGVALSLFFGGIAHATTISNTIVIDDGCKSVYGANYKGDVLESLWPGTVSSPGQCCDKCKV